MNVLNWRAVRALVICLAVFAFLGWWFANGAGAATKAATTNPIIPLPYQAGWDATGKPTTAAGPMNVWAVPGQDATTFLRGYLDMYVVVMSATTTPLSNVAVVLSLCEHGQQTAFELFARTRHLTGEENLSAFNGAHWLRWNVGTAPALGTTPKVLRLQLALPQGRSGPEFCVRVAGLANEGLATPAIEIHWWLK